MQDYLEWKNNVGNNEDTWRTGSKLWFEKGDAGNYGAAYLGLADGFPQGGMNEAGLCFDGFSVYPRALRKLSGKKQIGTPTEFIKSILQHCRTIAEVDSLAAQYDRSAFNRSMFLFVDNTGDYLVMEVDTLIRGNDSTYVLSNFCPSDTRPEDVQIERYKRGQAFIKERTPQANFDYTLAAMEKMHECRSKIGDGTAYTWLYDLTDGALRLYFYHDYTKGILFRLHDELKKDNHAYELTSLFPPNKEYDRLIAYRTPFNTRAVRVIMASATLFCLLTSMLYGLVLLINLFRRSDTKSPLRLHYLLFGLTNLLMALFIQLLFENEPAFYFDSPFSFGENFWINAMAYFPLALLISIVPLGVSFFKTIRTKKPNISSVVLVSLNMLLYMVFIIGTGYWHMINVF